MLVSDRIYSAYRDYLRDIKELRDQGLTKFIESKRYRKIRQTYLEYKATFRDPRLDKRVNDLLQIFTVDDLLESGTPKKNIKKHQKEDNKTK